MRARRRLIGAAVLVIIGIIVFPIVFETRPRPVRVDIPIEIPSRDRAPTLAMPADRSSGSDAVTGSGAAAVPKPGGVAGSKDDVIDEPPEVRSGAGTSPLKPDAGVRSQPTGQPQSQPQPKAPSQPERRAETPAPKLAEPAPRDKHLSAAEDGARARALLEGKTTASAAPVPGRFIVQIGAFADPASAQTVRQKAEKLGLKTYTQSAKTSAGERIRVRIGPFDSRDEADRALAKAKGAGLNAVLLTL